MPPASPSVTLVFLIASSREVFPWSTCPIIVTTGARACNVSGTSSTSSMYSSSFFSEATSTFKPKASAISTAASTSIGLLTGTIIPISISLAITSFDLWPIKSANSFTVIPSYSFIIFFRGFVISACRLPLPFLSATDDLNFLTFLGMTLKPFHL